MLAVLRVLLLRHAQSEWNAQGRWQGHADPPLSITGEQQVRLAAASLGGVDRIISSDLRRAAQSAAILAEALGSIPLKLDEGLRERDIGAWSGLTSGEIDVRWPGYRAAGKFPPGWESNGSVLQRALAAISRLARDLQSGVAVAVTHAGVIRSVEEHLGHRRQPLGNLTGRWLEVVPAGLNAGPRVDLITPA